MNTQNLLFVDFGGSVAFGTQRERISVSLYESAVNGFTAVQRKGVVPIMEESSDRIRTRYFNT